MRLKYVTLTGADDKVSFEKMYALSAKYPFVEWAILFSQSKAGVSRYPSYDWVRDLARFSDNKNMNLAAHLCGKWVDDVTNGTITFLEDKLMNSTFDRIQLNMSNGRLASMLYNDKLCNVISRVEKSVIFGANYKDIADDDYDREELSNHFKLYGISPLFDASGGRGIETKIWPKSLSGVLCGYAGGLNPNKFETQLQAIQSVVGDAVIWVDMETSIRTDDEFDLEKCEEVLKIAGNWV